MNVWINVICVGLALINLGFALWENDLAQAGAWGSAACGWAVALVYSIREKCDG